MPEPLKLRPYQEDAVQKILSSLDNEMTPRVCYALPTGGGKTVVLASLAMKWDGPVVILTHRKELHAQTKLKMLQLGAIQEEIGCISSRSTLVDGRRVIVVMVQTLNNRLALAGGLESSGTRRLVQGLNNVEGRPLLVIDECHHAPASTWLNIINAFKDGCPDTAILGVTATTVRSDGVGLKEAGFDQLIHGPSIRRLIELGFLRALRFYVLPRVLEEDRKETRDAVDSIADDYSTSTIVKTDGTRDFGNDADDERDKREQIGRPVQEYLNQANGRQAIVFAGDCDHSRRLAEEFNDRDIPAIHLDGKTRANDRDDAMARFRLGEIKVLCNYMLFSEGLDVPDVGCVVLGRRFGSELPLRQAIGRAMRVGEGDNAEGVVLDCYDNLERFPVDQAYQHSLDTRERTERMPGEDPIDNGDRARDLDSGFDPGLEEIDLVLREQGDEAYRQEFDGRVADLIRTKGKPEDLLKADLKAGKIKDVYRLVWAHKASGAGKPFNLLVMAADHALCTNLDDFECLARVMGPRNTVEGIRQRYRVMHGNRERQRSAKRARTAPGNPRVRRRRRAYY